MEYKDLHALVTGGTGGIGRAIVSALLERNAAKVCVLDINSDGETVVKELSEKFPSSQVEFYKADVTNYQQFQDCINWCVEKFGYLNLIINNAGIIVADSNIERCSLLFKTNLESVFYGTQLGTEVMNPKNGGKGGMIINTASIAGLMIGSLVPTAYGATKAGVIHLTRLAGMAQNVQQTSVQVNCVCPGAVNTEMLKIPELLEQLRQRSVAIDPADVMTPEYVAEGFIKVLESGESGKVLKVSPGQLGYRYHEFSDPMADD